MTGIILSLTLTEDVMLKQKSTCFTGGQSPFFPFRLPWLWFWLRTGTRRSGVSDLGQWEKLCLQDTVLFLFRTATPRRENNTVCSFDCRLPAVCIFVLFAVQVKLQGGGIVALWDSAAETEEGNRKKWEEITFLYLNLTLKHHGHVPASSTGSHPEADLNFNLFIHCVSNEPKALNFWAQTTGENQSWQIL